MATRSTIALEFADGTVQQVYCHWDGYIEYNGIVLQKFWSDPFKLQTLIDLGSLSSLGSELGEQHDFSARSEYVDNIATQCTFYGRDRNENDVGAKKFKNFDDYVDNHQFEEFEYILRTDGKWYVSRYPNKRYVELVAELAEADMDVA